MKIALLHGFNVSDGGKGTLGLWASTLRDAGHDAALLDYGWVGPLRVRIENMDVVERLNELRPDVIIGHSNGAAIAWQYMMQKCATMRGVVCVQPALNVDTVWPWRVNRIITLYNPHDYAVLWGRRWRIVNPVSWFVRHPWGAAGRYGFRKTDRRFTQLNTSIDPVYPYTGHCISSLEPSAVKYWIACILKELGGSASARGRC